MFVRRSRSWLMGFSLKLFVFHWFLCFSLIFTTIHCKSLVYACVVIWIQYPKRWFGYIFQKKDKTMELRTYDNPLSQTFGILCLGNVHWVSSSSSLNLLSQITEETNFIDIDIDSLVILLFIGTAVVNWFGVNWAGGQKVGWGWFASVQQEQLGLFGSDMHWSWWIKFSIWLHGIRVG